jgi:hypothetical protein
MALGGGGGLMQRAGQGRLAQARRLLVGEMAWEVASCFRR